MLRPSTRATWNPNVTMSVAYTAADSRVWTPDTTSLPRRSHALSSAGGIGTAIGSPGPSRAIGAGAVSSVAEGSLAATAGSSENGCAAG
jgi:hypothetical protein